MTDLVGIFYATREGQTKRVAEYAANGLQSRGLGVELRNLRDDCESIDLRRYAAVIIAASVHAGSHEGEVIEFVRARLPELERMNTAFLSVTLSQAGVERQNASSEEHARFAEDVRKMLADFFNETNWRPTHVQPVAGALAYSKYSLLVRFLMKRIAQKAGAETDTSHDYEYTNWQALDRFVEAFAAEIVNRTDSAASGPAAGICA